MSQIFQELLSSNPYAIIELFELHLNQDLHGSSEIIRFHAGVNQKTVVGDVYWQGNPYQALPIEVEGFEYNGNGQLPRPKVRVSNLLGSISALLLGVNEITPGNDLTGAKFIRIRTLSRFLDPVNFEGGVNPYGTPANEEMPREIYYIDRKALENREVVEFELAAVFDLAGVRAPKRQVIANICQWKYRSAECGYTGTNYFDEYDNALGATPATNFPATSFGNQLTAGEILNEGDAIVSANGWYRGIMQADGNFVVYNKAGSAVWATNTVRGEGYYRLRMQNDGNVVIYNGDFAVGNAIWATGTDSRAVPTTVAFVGWYPTDISVGRSGAFGYQIVGSSPSALGQQQTRTNTYTVGSRTITMQIVFDSFEIPVTVPPHYSGQSYGWGASTYTVTASTGTWYANEVFTAAVTITSGNPFRDNHPELGTLTSAGPQLQVTGVTGNTSNRFNLDAGGGLTVYGFTNTVLWASGYNNTNEPLVQTGTIDPLRDVCGKRISSCKKRFGDYNNLPFGSFPAAGTFYG